MTVDWHHSREHNVRKWQQTRTAR